MSFEHARDLVGLKRSVNTTASAPLDIAPATSVSAAAWSRTRSPGRKRGLSAAIRTRIGSIIIAPLALNQATGYRECHVHKEDGRW
jgi:hypothetical protein